MSHATEPLSGPELDELRQQAPDLARREDWAGVLALAPRLRLDTEHWVDIWAVTVAVLSSLDCGPHR